MGDLYDIDVIAWAEQQAVLLRAGRFSELDIEHIAEEIEDVAKSEMRALANRMAELIAHLLKWELQPALRGRNGPFIIRTQRRLVKGLLQETPSLRRLLEDPERFEGMWEEATGIVAQETGLDDDIPLTSIWTPAQILDESFLP